MTAPAPPRPTEESLWLALAELFFLDTEPGPGAYERVAELLQQAGWTRQQTRTVLIEIITPVAGANLGWLVYPVIGEWAGFSPETLLPQLRAMQQKRASRSRLRLYLQDMNSRRMLKKLEADRLLLDRLPA